MTTTTPIKHRTLRLTRTGDTLALVITQQDGDGIRRECYYLQPIASGFALSKSDGTRYHTSASVCDCPDQRHRGRLRPCKHISAVRKLKELGKL
jgi:hypothetical protein